MLLAARRQIAAAAPRIRDEAAHERHPIGSRPGSLCGAVLLDGLSDHVRARGAPARRQLIELPGEMIGQAETVERHAVVVSRNLT